MRKKEENINEIERKAKTMDKKNDDLYRVINRKEQYSRRILFCGAV